MILLIILVLAAIGLTFWMELAPREQPVQTRPETTEEMPAARPSTQPPQNVQESAPPVETTDPVLDRARELLSGMTLEEKICQLFIVTQEQLTGYGTVTQSGPATREAIEKHPVGGIIYFSPNLVSREQCSEMIRNIQSYSRLGLFIAVDEEGGIVNRLGGKPEMGITDFPNMGTIGKEGNPDAAYEVGYTIGTEIAELGFNLDFAPVADVDSNPNNPVIGQRAFHSDPEIAAEMVAACVEGFRDSGILCTLKHFPGHGDTGTDSHYGEAKTDKTLLELMECELLPFRSGIEAGAPVVMVGHITAPEVTQEDVPATVSREIVTDLLREQLGFSGLVVTDSMSMQAITGRYSSGEAAVRAVQAGVDMILMPQSLTGAISGLRDAVADGILTEERIDESVLRILEQKLRSGIIPMA